ncbi:hypothetical protein BDV98DRAFT_564427 [Pterulicium gracile]|uniref:Secreted protein n=1 Tax=Pterulicium gracile TaxID=1884261 RepID=A0A5C3QNK0_9AGAR|nr:hypothetical protein BDV98DRAFT_564427 [Pterula gracilis]
MGSPLSITIPHVFFISRLALFLLSLSVLSRPGASATLDAAYVLPHTWIWGHVAWCRFSSLVPADRGSVVFFSPSP